MEGEELGGLEGSGEGGIKFIGIEKVICSQTIVFPL